jgi:hypothetical protein
MKALVYLDASVIMDTKLNDDIDSAKTGFYDAENIHPLAVDKLIQELEWRGVGYVRPPSVEVRQG